MSRFDECRVPYIYPFEAAECLLAAMRGDSAPEPSTREMAGFMMLADAIHCLQHLREAYSAKK